MYEALTITSSIDHVRESMITLGDALTDGGDVLVGERLAAQRSQDARLAHAALAQDRHLVLNRVLVAARLLKYPHVVTSVATVRC